MHWAAKYIGRRGLDCWSLMRSIYAEQFNLPLPEMPGISAASTQTIHSTIVAAAESEWEGVNMPFDGCAVAMSQSEAMHHVGVWVDGDHCTGRILHACGGQVMADTLRGIRLKGFRCIKFYRHRQWKQDTT